jgi:endonuclease G
LGRRFARPIARETDIVLELTGSERKALREAIQSAYPTPDDLDQFLDESLSINLAVVAGSGIPYGHIVGKLITQWAIPKGQIDRLVLALAEDTENPAIQTFGRRVLGQYLRLNPVATPFPPLDWDRDWAIPDEELQGFLPRQFSLEQDVGDLRRGLALADSVCRLSDRQGNARGTGVLIAPDLVLTNYHVLSLQPTVDLNPLAAQLTCEFGYISTALGQRMAIARRAVVATDPVVQTSPIAELDYALLRIAPTDRPVTPIPLAVPPPVAPKDPLHLLQHPAGEQMKVSLSNNGVVSVDDRRGLVLYVNATQGGSSGAPCFNGDWQLVALHHKEKATSFGGSVREGILLSAIYQEISPIL